MIENLKLIVGLGNPGFEYQKTRHNVGYLFLDWLEENHQDWIEQNKIRLLRPTKFMNRSGFEVQEISSYYKIPVENILVVQDDLDLDFGVYKLKKSGVSSGDGGHKGIRSIIEQLKSDKFIRLKIGIGRPENLNNNNYSEISDYVLSNFTKEQFEELPEIFAEIFSQLF